MKINVLRALTGFRIHAGDSPDVAAAWATAHQEQGTTVSQIAIAADHEGNPHSMRRSALVALRKFARGE